MPATKLLHDLAADVRRTFVVNRRVLSFAEYFELFSAAPQTHARNAAQYLLDAVEYFGTEEVLDPAGKRTRYRLFDTPFEQGRDRLVGQEACQAEIHRIIKNFVREGRVNRLILLHGPNGSAKSRIVDCLARALSHYSRQDEGALYRFNWIFPSARIAKKPLGFGEDDRPHGPLLSYAYLEDKEIDVQLTSPLRDHPLLLLPRDQRARILRERVAALGLEGPFEPADALLYGGLSPKSRDVFEALLRSYQGDYERVLQHVQVERFFISRRYRQGIVTVEPQMHVDATVRQITMDRTLENLPSSLRNVTLFEPGGDLVDANRGLIEYNDLLKRPVEAFKYLLATCEKSNVALPNCILYLDLVFIGSSNEKHLSAFKTMPDFPSFKGRIELVRVPYLRSYKAEQQIYTDHVRDTVKHKHVAPHTTDMTALWAVLTRMKPVPPDAVPPPDREVVAKLTPLEKAQLYALGQEPRWMPADRRGRLRALIPDLIAAGQDDPDYEGSLGASPREMKFILLNAAQDPAFPCLSPLAVLAELERLVRDPSVYDFLQTDPAGPFFDHRAFVAQVQDVYLDLIDREFRDAMGLVGEAEYALLFQRYVSTLGHLLQGEKQLNPLTGKHEPPDQRFLAEMERKFQVAPGSEQAFRERVIRDIAAQRIDHPGEPVVYPDLFPKLFDTLRESYYEGQRETVDARRLNVLRTLRGESGALQPSDREDARRSLQTLRERFGFCDACAREAAEALHRRRP